MILAKTDALLEKAGTTKKKILTANIMLRDVDKDFDDMKKIWNEWLDPGNKLSASSRVTVGTFHNTAISNKNILVEIQVTAALNNNSNNNCCMSFTAPQFSPEDEQKELDALNDEEREALRQDCHGYTSIRREPREFLDTCLAQFEEALKDIPLPQKETYLQGKFQYPELLADETDPVVFLRAEDYQPEVCCAVHEL